MTHLVKKGGVVLSNGVQAADHGTVVERRAIRSKSMKRSVQK